MIVGGNKIRIWKEVVKNFRFRHDTLQKLRGKKHDEHHGHDKIRTWYLQKTSLKSYRYANLPGNRLLDSCLSILGTVTV